MKENRLSFTSEISMNLTAAALIPDSDAMPKLPGLILACCFCFGLFTSPGAERVHTFTKIHPTDKFWAEGANFADFNHDGKMDLVYGPFWFEGPDLKKAHEYAPANATFKRKAADGAEETV